MFTERRSESFITLLWRYVSPISICNLLAIGCVVLGTKSELENALPPVNGKKAGTQFSTPSESAAYLSGALFSAPLRGENKKKFCLKVLKAQLL